MSEPPRFDGVELRGIQFCSPMGRSATRILVGGEGLMIVREPSNPHDRNAIEVYYDDVKIGYVAPEVAAEAAPWIDAGICYMTSVTAAWPCDVPYHYAHVIMRMVPIKPKPKSVTTEKEKEREDA